ncbi:hypothetical protein K438DRAFT_1009290 [Mycena galopus ATCC 62051]|nr:hypothetical protein K438DRAFT_1009290 [Mycena galopus ATCC 62051]
MIASQVPVHHVIVILASLLPLVTLPSSMRRFRSPPNKTFPRLRQANERMRYLSIQFQVDVSLPAMPLLHFFMHIDLQSLSNRSDRARRRTLGLFWACFQRTKTKTGDDQLTTANLKNSGLPRGNIPVPSPIPVAPSFRSSRLLDRLPIRSGDG